jgi:hypothetical protein
LEVEAVVGITLVKKMEVVVALVVVLVGLLL